MFKSLFGFITSKVFLKQVVIYFLFLGAVLGLLLWWLNVYTKHGEYIKVPDFKGLPVAKLKAFAAKNEVAYLIIDSLFEAKTPPGVVIKQDPERNAEVKEGREVYLYISASLPPEVPMPKLIDRSLRQAISMINSYGFTLGKINFVADECTNCVLEQRIKGKEVKQGAIVSKGSVIDLTAGKGMSDITTRMPCLYGLTKNEAIIKLAESSLAVGRVFYQGPKDNPDAKVYKQLPSCNDREGIERGELIDIYLTTRKNIIPEAPVDTVAQTKSDAEDFDNEKN